MGYQGISTESGKKHFFGSTFSTISGAKVKLGDIGTENGFIACSDTLIILNEFGGTKGCYYYMDEDNVASVRSVPGNEDAPIGWYEADAYDNWDWGSVLPNANNVELEYGESVMLEVGNDGASLFFNGQVDQEDVERKCEAGKKAFRCNSTPVAITLGDLKANSLIIACSDTLIILNEFGGTKGCYYYMDEDNVASVRSVPGNEDAPIGWYDADAYDNWDWDSVLPNANNVELPAGEGFMLEVGNDDAGVIVPSAL